MDNMQNRHKLQANNTSGYMGVSYRTATGKWKADISINNKTKFLGYFLTAKLASLAYKNAKLLLTPSISVYSDR